MVLCLFSRGAGHSVNYECSLEIDSIRQGSLAENENVLQDCIGLRIVKIDQTIVNDRVDFMEYLRLMYKHVDKERAPDVDREYTLAEKQSNPIYVDIFFAKPNAPERIWRVRWPTPHDFYHHHVRVKQGTSISIL